MALEETLAFDDAVKTASDLTSPNDTLIVVTADHSHVFVIAGYPSRENSITGSNVTTIKIVVLKALLLLF